MKNISVLILTYNEEININECLKSVKASNDVVILDSFSTDRTKEIAQKHKTRFIERKFTDYSDQRNFGLHEIEYKNEYLLILDADERVSSELSNELSHIGTSTKTNNLNVYFVKRKILFEEKILKWNYTSTVWIERLVKPKMVKYIGYVHEKVLYEGKNGFLQEYIIHDTFSKGIKNWVDRRKKYAKLEIVNLEKQNQFSLNNNEISKRMRIKSFVMNKIPFFLYCILFIIYFLNLLS